MGLYACNFMTKEELDCALIEREQLREQLADANERIEALKNDVLEEIENRDNREEWLDKLSDEVARYFGVDIGEHSSANNPWREALDAIPEGALNKFAIEQQYIGGKKLLDSIAGKHPPSEISSKVLLVLAHNLEQLRKEQEKC